MRLQEIKHLTGTPLCEAFRQTITREDAINFIRRNCRNALKTINEPIVRGMKYESDFQIITGQDGGRKSANTTNHYTLLLDKWLPSEYPRRSLSIICAGWPNREYTHGFGTRHVIIPIDHAKIGVTPKYDLWDTPITIGNETLTIKRWNDEMRNAGVPDSSYQTIITSLRKIRDSDDFSTLSLALQAMEEYNGGEDFERYLARAYTLPFDATTTADPIYNYGEHEVWIQEKCIAIDYALWSEFKRDLENETN